MKLSVCLIVKNEEQMLAKCLQSVQQADEIIICDTGSTDKTVEIALQYTPHVFTDYTWNDNFAEARNHAKSKATGDYILSIDADETLSENGIKLIRKLLQKPNLPDAFSIPMVDANIRHVHYLVRLFKNTPEIFWEVGGGGYVHETINNTGSKITEHVSITYGYSPTHMLDPGLDMRLLEKSVIDFPANPRNYYYFAREYYYRREYLTASNILRSYLNLSTFLEEKADAWLMLARCLWQMHKGDDARIACLNAIGINANFKEAVLFMAELSWEHNAKTWRKFAESCTNENVLFVR